MSDKPNVSSDFPGFEKVRKDKRGATMWEGSRRKVTKYWDRDKRKEKRQKKKADEEINEGEINGRLLRAADSRQRR